MAETDTASFSAALSIVVGAQFIKQIAPLPVVSNLFNVMNEGNGLTSKVARWPDITGGISDPVTEGSDVATQAITPTGVSLTPTVTGIAFEITDLLATSQPFAGMMPYIEIGADVLVEQSEDDIHALFASLNGGTRIGTSGSAMTFSILLDGAVTLKVAQVPGPYFGALAPIAVADLAADLGGLGGMQGGTSMGLTETAGGRPGLKGVVSSIPIYECPRAVSINTNADRESLIAHKDCISIRTAWTMRPEQERDALGVSTNIVITNAYGLAETADNYGIPIETDHE